MTKHSTSYINAVALGLGILGLLELCMWSVCDRGLSLWLPETFHGPALGFILSLLMFFSAMFRAKVKVLLSRVETLNVRRPKRYVAFAAALLAILLFFSVQDHFAKRALSQGWGITEDEQKHFSESRAGDLRFVLLEAWLAGALVLIYFSLPQAISLADS